MRIHDKFVIELAEVIKGYGNDYQAEEPFHLPCDYKFYEISGVAICEESVKRMIPLNVEIQKVLDKIRVEIDQKQFDFMDDDDYEEGIRFGLMLAYQIIDKYRKVD